MLAETGFAFAAAPLVDSAQVEHEGPEQSYEQETDSEEHEVADDGA